MPGKKGGAIWCEAWKVEDNVALLGGDVRQEF